MAFQQHGNLSNRLKLLEKRPAEQYLVVAETQITAFKNVKDEKSAHGEIEICHPDYLWSQNTFKVGIIIGQGNLSA